MSEFEHAARGRHVLVAGGSGNRGFVELQFTGDVAQPERLHRDIAIVEKVFLPGDDRFSDAEDGCESLFGIAHQPTGFLKLLPELRMTGVAGAAKDFGIAAIDPNIGQDRRVDGGDPLLAMAPHDDIGHHVTNFVFGE